MSLALAYRVRLAEPGILADLGDFLRARAEPRGWVLADAPPRRLARARLRALDGSLHDRPGLDLAGHWLNAHFAADDLCLVFDRATGELVDAERAVPGDQAPEVRGFGLTRTTWAEPATHLAMLGLLEDLAAEGAGEVEVSDPTGRELPTTLEAAEARQREARGEVLRAARKRAAEPFRAGVVELLAPDDAARRRAEAPGPLDRLEAREREPLLRLRRRFVDTWGPTTPGLDGPPDVAAAALEQLTDRVLSDPTYRHDPEFLHETFAWESGVALGFLLCERLGGHWDKVEGERGPSLRVVNLGGHGLTWRPLKSAAERIRGGPLWAHDEVLRWLVTLSLDLAAAETGA